jgi:regulatory protein
MKPTQPHSLKPLPEVAMALLARREHTVAELRKKLKDKGYELSEINTIIETLQAKNYLNDTRAAALLVQRRAVGSKWGAGRIAQELAAKGIGKELAKSRLAALTEGEAGQAGHDWLATATGLLRAKYKQPLPTEATEKRKEQARRLGFLQRRGFTMQQALKALVAAGLGSIDEEA